MIKKFFSIFFWVVISYESVAKDNSVVIHDGFIKGNDFRILDANSKNKYSMGVIDGILLSPLYGAPKSRLEVFEDCVIGMKSSQISAIFDKYLLSHPEKWHRSMHTLAFVALKESCNL